MFDAVAVAVGVYGVASGDAASRFEATYRIVNASVNDLGVSLAGLSADGIRGLDHDHLMAGQSQLAGDRKADYSGADYDSVNLFGHNVDILASLR